MIQNPAIEDKDQCTWLLESGLFAVIKYKTCNETGEAWQQNRCGWDSGKDTSS